jgi:hypothetical protein
MLRRSPQDKPQLETTDSRPPLRRFLLPVVMTIAIFTLLAFAVQPQDRFTSDFYSFWAGARLVGPHLYDPAQASAIQHSVSPLVEHKRYIRPPYYAVFLWPLGRLPFGAAYAAWFILNLAALLGFVWAWRFHPAGYRACALFLPLVWSFGTGQDAALMLFALAAGGRLIHRKQEIAGGAVLALWTAKPHLLLFVPVVLLAQRKYRALAGMLAGGAVLYLISAAVLGFQWPAVFYRAIMTNESGIKPYFLGVTGLLVRVTTPKWLYPVLALAGAALVFVFTRAAAWRPSLAFAIAAGVVFAPRSMLYDASFFLPLLLLRCPAAVTAIAGALFCLVLTPAAAVAEVAGIAALWLGLPRRSKEPDGAL